MKKLPFSPETVLREHGSKATALRIFLLQLLHDAPIPLTVKAIAKKTKRLADTATVYRSLNAFVEMGIARQHELVPGKASFESLTKTHSHYVVCDSCNVVEPIDLCMRHIQESALKKSRKFKSVFDHRLSFSGTCKKCVRAIR